MFLVLVLRQGQDEVGLCTLEAVCVARLCPAQRGSLGKKHVTPAKSRMCR